MRNCVFSCRRGGFCCVKNLGIRKPNVKGGTGERAEKLGSPAKRLPRLAGCFSKAKKPIEMPLI